MTREETIRKVLDKVLWTINASDDNKRILTDALIEALEQEPKMGKWIYDTGRYGNDIYDDSWHYIYRCSECGRTVAIDSQQYRQVVEKYPYCHCGAKMESESNE